MFLSQWEFYPLIPLLVTLVLAFLFRSALVAMIVGTFIGTLLIGMLPGADAFGRLSGGMLSGGDAFGMR